MIKNYTVIQSSYIDEVKSEAMLLKHDQTGAMVVLLSNKDHNKVFNIGFRTPPTDSTGVPHIIEHTVLCGSKDFPVKDPFVELVKGSLNTFLNAMTYPDKTVYPVASCNEKDFQNLMHVYLDAVFYPNIYKHQEIFWQEGWHYEMASKDDPLTYNGVVYNEMKGAFSSPEQVLFRKIMHSLYPDTVYGVESGGDPANIPDLTYEDYLDFHRRYYHPSNSYIYLYGDMDMEEKLRFIDEQYLSHFEPLSIDSTIQKQPVFEKVNVCEDVYAITDEDSMEENTYLTYNVVIEDSLDEKLYLAFQVLEYVLMSSPGAPLKKALINKGIGKDAFGQYDNGVLQPYMSIIVKNADPEQKDEFVTTIKEVLTKIVKDGLSKRSLEGAINYFEFRFKEGDFGRFPAGLMYGLQIMDSWLYDETKPFIHIAAAKTFEWLKEQVETGYFEELIKKYLLENPHTSILVLKPEKGLSQAEEAAVKKLLADKKAAMSDEEIESIVKATEDLRAYQEAEDAPEDIAKIPLLSIEDIEKKALPYTNQWIEDEQILFHDIETNGIAYLKYMFDTKDIPVSKIPYIGLISSVLGNMDTKNYSYGDLNDEINIYTGGLASATNLYVKNASEDYSAKLEVNMKALYSQLDKGMALMKEMIFETKFEDTKRLKEIIDQLKSRMEMAMNSNGHTMSVARASAYTNESGLYKDLMEGLGFYQFIAEIAGDFDNRKEEIVSELRDCAKNIFTKEHLMIDLTARKEGLEIVKASKTKMIECLFEATTKHPDVHGELQEKLGGFMNEAFITAGTVQYDAVVGNFIRKGFKYDGSLNVLKVMMSYDYLWTNIRVKGGAYGCMCGFSVNGNGYFTSYRDPKLKETYEVYRGAVDYVKNFEADERTMTKYIIGAISALDTPLTPSGAGARSLGAYLADLNETFTQNSRDELLATDVEKIRSLAGLVEAIVESPYICVFGSSQEIHKNEELFNSIETLIR